MLGASMPHIPRETEQKVVDPTSPDCLPVWTLRFASLDDKVCQAVHVANAGLRVSLAINMRVQYFLVVGQ